MEKMPSDGGSDSSRAVSAHQRALCLELWELRSAGVLCDAVLDIGGELLGAHRAVLSAASPFFRHHCLNPPATTADGAVLIPVETCSYQAGFKAVEYLYTGCREGVGKAELLEEFNRICRLWQLSHLPCGEAPSSSQQDCKIEPSCELKDSDSGGQSEQESDVSDQSWGFVDKPLTLETKEPQPKRTVNNVKRRPRGRPRKRTAKRKCAARLKKSVIPHVPSPGAESVQNQEIEESIVVENSVDTYNEKHENDVIEDTKNEIRTQEISLDVETIDTIQTRSKKTGHTKLKFASANRQTLLFKKNSCQRCKMVFATREEFLDHRKGAHPKVRKHWCNICDKKFPDSNLLQLHNMENHWKEGMKMAKKYTCTEVGCSFSSFIYATWHKHRSVHGAEPRDCELCGKTLKNAFTMKQHMENQHTRTTAYPCDVCGRTFTTKGNMKAHKEARHLANAGREKLVCPRCAFVCWCKTSMSEHLLLKHDELMPARKLYTCQSCDFKTTIQAKMKEHSRGHNAGERLACEVCGKTYKSVKLLNRHKKIHDNTAKVTRCMYCDYTTLHGVGTLGNHLRFKHRDRDPKPWPCSECPHKATTRESLTYHLQSVHRRDAGRGFTDDTDTPLNDPVGDNNLLSQPADKTPTPDHPAEQNPPHNKPMALTPSLYAASAAGLLPNHQSDLNMGVSIPSNVPPGMSGTTTSALPGTLEASHLQFPASHSVDNLGPQMYRALPQGYMHPHDDIVNPMYIHSMGF